MKIRLMMLATALAAIATGASASTNLVFNGTFNNVYGDYVANYPPYVTDDFQTAGATAPDGWTVVNNNEMWIGPSPNGYDGITQSPGNAANGGLGYFVDLT